MIEAGVRVMPLLEQGHKPRNAASLQMTGNKMNGFSLESPEKNSPDDTFLVFSHVKTYFQTSDSQDLMIINLGILFEASNLFTVAIGN